MAATHAVEPCFTCTGAPSVCTPSPDGAACDDRNACTTGETCTAGACGGGTPVSPCLNLTGQWLEHVASPLLGTIDSIVDIVQVGTILEFDGSPTTIPGRFGTIDPVTGAVVASTGVGQLFCPLVETTTGTAAADGNSYTLSGNVFEQSAGTPDECISSPIAITGTRCNGPCLLPTTTTTTTTTSTTTTTTLPQLLSGKVLLLKDDVDAARKRLLVKSKDRSFSIGLGNGSSDDPTLAGATVRVRMASGCGGSPCDALYVLPAEHWTVVGAPGANKGYKYRDSLLASGPFRGAIVKPARQLSLTARGAQLMQTLDENPVPVDIVVTIGANRSCLTFGGTAMSTFKAGSSFKATGAAAPGTCPP